jgi:hypothetical protein
MGGVGSGRQNGRLDHAGRGTRDRGAAVPAWAVESAKEACQKLMAAGDEAFARYKEAVKKRPLAPQTTGHLNTAQRCWRDAVVLAGRLVGERTGPPVADALAAHLARRAVLVADVAGQAPEGEAQRPGDGDGPPAGHDRRRGGRGRREEA